MAYTPETLHQMPSLIGGKVKLWTYETEDAITSVDDTDYFAGAVGRGMGLNNIVLIIDTNAGALYLARVSAVDSDGNATISVTTTVAEQSAITSLTDNTGGTADNTLANLADGSTYANDHAAIENNFADLAAKVNAILTALRAAGVIAT